MTHFYLNASLGLSVGTTDLILLTNFVCSSSMGSAHSQSGSEHSWIPICLPGFNSSGYLQAYVGKFSIEESAVVSEGWTLIMIAVSGEPNELQNLMSGKVAIQQVRCSTVYVMHCISCRFSASENP